MTTKAQMRELADDLQMLASQIRESTGDPKNAAPHPWTFDDWFTKYRDAHKHLAPPCQRCGLRRYECACCGS